MIRLAQSHINPIEVTQQWNLNEMAMKILYNMSEREQSYDYRYIDELQFEIVLRSNIVNAAYQLHLAGPGFATFANSRCNPHYWHLTNNGGFLLREGILPSTAIQDIFHHGSYYAFECSMAGVIVLYKAMLDTILEETFNLLFRGLFIWDGYADKHLQLQSLHLSHFLPGDIIYVKNPEVDPYEIQWQGENAVDLGNGAYYGHGIGITSIPGIIQHLNQHRIQGSVVSAYLTDNVLRPNFRLLASLDGSFPTMALRGRGENKGYADPLKAFVVAQVGTTIYILA